ncbi:hypothetical protein HNR60_001748 [Rhodopseudomonas rhenobacensis]|uniref:Right handed beta helix domain-containing protein n=1 Tax=Rhodopseudomonas rhenobacensis TaxID=87461 RepID=A0A7W7Z2X9_9BRAD|nr:right-handed parallel beta-helix repeat-containing protein [Rhodopseudomonas rhenobacensis]MBB5046996.1 hypothetical protein [Rhodopseudomonas rhenobacensis]
MSKILISILLGLLSVVMLSAAPASAQASRTWVSGVGDDANPCSRTAPCKTFAGAISKTAAGGEIDALDPGGFGAVTITKSITIDGGGGQGGQVAGILASGTVGINVNAQPSDVIIIRNLSINGVGTGTNGINFLAGSSLEIENVKIMNFSANCVRFQPTVKANLIITNSALDRCLGGGLSSSATSGGTNLVQINRSTIYRSSVAVTSGANSSVQIWSSVISNNGVGGVLANAATGQVSLDQSTVTNNGFGVQAQASGIVRLTNTSVIANTGTGLFANGGQILTWQNNWVAGNAPDGARTGTIVPQ